MSWSVRVKHDDKDCYRISLRIGKSRWKVGHTHCYGEDITENDAWVSVMKEAVKLEMMMTELIGEK
mgnify:FL=1|jgi:hypothetical protein|tara:strand:- start:5894 stop:6091 length:198 start_codon:yes stop_codon:yes gene_type:complete